MKLRVLLLLIIIIYGCTEEPIDKYEWRTIKVTATAYNSLAYQTSPNPNIAAWGDSLIPGMKCIAVSRDLITQGLKHNTPVKIDGFDGIFLVKDKMNRRWKNRIDIYMDNDVKKAKKWGKRKLVISYGILNEKMDIPANKGGKTLLNSDI